MDKIGTKEAQLRQLKEARAERGRKVERAGFDHSPHPGQSAEYDARRKSNPGAKASKGKTGMAGCTGGRKTKQPPAGDASRLGAGRTAQDRGKASPAAVAIRKSAPSLRASRHAELLPKREPAGDGAGTKRGRGRPRIAGERPWEAAGMSKRTWYRRKAEGKL